ncbi:hypothetical protein XBJ2_2370010 [Xenorhabdus bovienii str. Jollieti]|uniref:Transposase n=1 Tax=Xenorhabdus bovienii (strain SS-2004) TaxID=406818 RepID=D3V768_XENBS|nr:hypothetical protein XBJ1_4394 [Xenorhabdus bovienii SS-2004]CDH29245.1 hypothetical protein XBJ2_2370010 [Xenorhabdus bovienii str. Jollieti]
MHHMKNKLAELEALIAEHINQHPNLKKDFELLTSIKGIGTQMGLNVRIPLLVQRKSLHILVLFLLQSSQVHRCMVECAYLKRGLLKSGLSSLCLHSLQFVLIPT